MGKKITAVILVICVIVGYFLYKNIDPSSNVFAPKCLSYTILGFRCPGCGTQRAVFNILNGNIINGLSFNPLMILSVPYFSLLLIMQFSKVKQKFAKLYSVLYGFNSVWILIGVLIIYTLLRNIFNF